MRFGLYSSPIVDVAAPDGFRQGYARFVDYVLAAEAAGFSAAFIAEHHFTGLGQASSSLSILAYLAALTRRIRLGTAVIVLPWHNPLLLAEQVATVDVLSDGRFDFGVGRGYRGYEFEGFAIPREEAGERFSETLALTRAILAGTGPASHATAHWRFTNVFVEPRPVQRPHPPIWQAGSSEASIRNAAGNGNGLMLALTDSPERVAANAALFHRAREEAGLPFDPDAVSVSRVFSLAGDGEAERREAIRHALDIWELRANQQTPGRPFPFSDKTARVEQILAEDSFFVGSIARIGTQIAALEAIGIRNILLSDVDNVPEALDAFGAAFIGASASDPAQLPLEANRK